MTTDAAPMLAATDVVGGYGKVQILNGVTLRVARGQIAALLGGNGTGKSTMLKALSGLIKPWGGSIVFDGDRIDGMRPDLIVRRGLVQVTQGKEAYPSMTVEENLLLGAHVKPDRATRARGLERSYGYFPILKERRRQLTGTLSATGYVLSQADYLGDLEFVYGEFKTYQVPLTQIEQKTGLRFGLSEHDPLDRVEAHPQREIRAPSDIAL